MHTGQVSRETRQTRRPRSSVHDDGVGRCISCDCGRRGCRKGEDRGDREGPDGTDGQNGGSEDGATNSHDCLHASTEVDSL